MLYQVIYWEQWTKLVCQHSPNVASLKVETSTWATFEQVCFAAGYWVCNCVYLLVFWYISEKHLTCCGFMSNLSLLTRNCFVLIYSYNLAKSFVPTLGLVRVKPHPFSFLQWGKFVSKIFLRCFFSVLILPGVPIRIL